MVHVGAAWQIQQNDLRGSRAIRVVATNTVVVVTCAVVMIASCNVGRL